MGNDTTENVRRELVRQLNAEPKGRAALELKHGQVWDTQELGTRLRGQRIRRSPRDGAKEKRRSARNLILPA